MSATQQYRDQLLRKDLQLTGARQTEAQNMPLYGQIRWSGVGESTIDLIFPVRYKNKPSLSFSAELAPGQDLVDGYFPTVSVIVSQWNRIIDNTPYNKYYKGCKLAVVCGGYEGQKLIIFWQINGTAFMNPI